ncbi:hypothetical protein [Xanthomonas oryzae]|nr:hypothetical protein [Xanthomonas oryzae]
MLPEIHNIREFEREAPDEKLGKLIRALDLTLESTSLTKVNQFFKFRNKVAHAKHYARAEEPATWKGNRPRIPSTDPSWAKQARPGEARRFVEIMENVIDRMNEASMQKIGQDFPLDVFGSGSQVYCP